MHYVSTRDPQHRSRCSSEAIAQGIAPDGGLFVPSVSALRRRVSSTARRAAGDRRAPARAVRRRRSARRRARRDLPRGIRLSGAARAARPTRRRRLSVLELFHGPTSRVQGFRRALSRGVPGAHSPRRADASSRSSSRPPAIPAARSRRRSTTGRGSTSSCCIRRAWCPQRQAQQLACWGGNVRTFAVQRHVRRLPAHGEGGVPRSGARARRISSRPRTASTSAACCRRWCTTRRRAWSCGARPAGARTSSFRPATSAIRSRASGRATSACRSARSCSRRTRIRP